jgi:hypothetical protein
MKISIRTMTQTSGIADQSWYDRQPYSTWHDSERIFWSLSMPSGWMAQASGVLVSNSLILRRYSMEKCFSFQITNVIIRQESCSFHLPIRFSQSLFERSETSYGKYDLVDPSDNRPFYPWIDHRTNKSIYPDPAVNWNESLEIVGNAEFRLKKRKPIKK